MPNAIYNKPIFNNYLTPRSYLRIQEGKSGKVTISGVKFEVQWFGSTHGIKLAGPINLSDPVIRERSGDNKTTWLIDEKQWTPIKVGDDVIIPGIGKFQFDVDPGKTVLIDPRAPEIPSLQIGPLKYGQWEHELKCLIEEELKFVGNDNPHTFGMKSIDQVLSFTQEKANAMGAGTKPGLPKKVNMETILSYLAGNLYRLVAEKYHLRISDELFNYALAVLSIRILHAKAKMEDDLSSPVIQEDISVCNKFFDKNGYPFRIGFID